MSIKGLFFSLLTYLGLVWVVAVYRSEGPNATTQIRRFGLFWTALGLAAVLAWIIGSRVFAWWRARRAKAAAAPKPTIAKPAAPVLNEDDQALIALLAEANAVLKKAPDYAGLANPLDSLPVYLIVGPEGTGKTSSFANSSLTPGLLAGNASAAVAPAVTRIANVWLAGGAIFIEVAGRVFSSDTGRFTEFLRVLERGGKAAAMRTGLRRLWEKPESGLRLHGVIAFCEAKAFSGAPNPDKAARESRAWQERLQAIAEVFGVEFPVYQVISKCDSVAFYDDYFKRMPGPEAQQVLGCTLDRGEVQPRQGEVSVDAAAKRLTSAFNNLFYALARRRITHLAHEPDPTRRPGVYEFPRELKRLRPALIQFLAEIFRPSPLRSGPVLRGFYFTGVREVEAFAAEVGATRVDWSAADLASDATRLFRGDATQFLRPDDVRAGGSRGGTTREWMFTSDLFQTVVLPDRPARKLTPPARPIDAYRKPALVSICALCGLLCALWIVSWNRNRAMLDNIRNVARIDARTQDARPTLGDLRALDALREQTGILAQHERGRRPLFMRFGLYSGDRLLAPARRTYFLRFQQLILNGLDATIAANLEALPSEPPPDAAYAPAYAALATHLMISPAACKADPALVATVLKSAADQTGVGGSAEGAELTRKQIDFYADELRYGNPCRIPENQAAVDRGRRYLASIKGPERIYAGMLSNIERTIGKPQRLADVASNYTAVLSGPAEVPGAFSIDGWAAFDKAAAQGGGDAGDACILGSAAHAGDRSATPDVSLAVKRLYAEDYVRRWRNFVTGFSVLPYASAEDAARKLEILSDHRSPLLAVLYMTAKQTSAPPAPAAADGMFEKAKKTGSEVLSGITGDKKPDEPAQAGQTGAIGRADLARMFQPVQVVVPPQNDTWINEKNGAYVEALTQLAHAMQGIAKNQADAAAQQAAQQSYDKAIDSVRQIARAFKPVGVGGIDNAVERLLEQPIDLARRFLVDPDKAAAGRINGELRAMCSGPGAVLRRYPFNPSGDDATLQDVSRLLAPGAGALWQFQAQSLGEFVVRDGGVWKSKDPAKKPQVAPEMLALLNRAQRVSDAFFPPGAALPSVTFVLRPRMDNPATVVMIDIDGQRHEWTNSLQKQFTFPTPGGKATGAVVRMRSGSATVPVASEGGLWGVFRIMADAEPRPPGSKVVEWKKVRAGGGRVEPVDPPVRLEIVEFPGGVDMFNPRFFDGFGCPARAVQ